MTINIALLSDIHGNSPALQAVLNDIQSQGCTKVFMLGDIINGVDLHGCIQILREWCTVNEAELICLKGNGEEYLLTPQRDKMPDQDKPWNIDMLHLAQWWQDHLTAADIEWLQTFHHHLFWEDACLVHDHPIDRLHPESWHKPNIEPKYQDWFYHSRGIAPQMSESEWQRLWKFMEEQNIPLLFCGHTHIPFYRSYAGRRVYNLGSAGATSDGDPHPSWVLMNKSSGVEDEITIRRVEYDITLIHDLIDQTPDYYDFKDEDFKRAYKQWLATGIFWK
ncbi:MAG: metallophosphoesterase family protein, partial [Chloroflexota bacterium]